MRGVHGDTPIDQWRYIMRRFKNRTIEELRRFRDDARNLAKSYYIAIYENHDYRDGYDRIRMETVYAAAKQDLKDVIWEIEGRELGIID